MKKVKFQVYNDSMTHDSYLCETYKSEHWRPFPVQRRNGLHLLLLSFMIFSMQVLSILWRRRAKRLQVLAQKVVDRKNIKIGQCANFANTEKLKLQSIFERFFQFLAIFQKV